MNYHKFLRILIFSTIFFAQFSFALNPRIDLNAKKTVNSNKHLSIELYNGYLNGRARELVYDASNGKKISELFWKIAEAYVVGGSLTAHLHEKFKIGVNGWTPLASKNTMDDYDWLNPKHDDWSDWSHYSDTKLRHAYMFDARAAFKLLSTKDTAKIRSSMDVIGGCKWLNAAWTSYGGSYIQSSKNNFRDHAGIFANGATVIAYEQWWRTPYIGLGGEIGIQRFTLSAEVIKSFWAKGHDHDDHHIRGIVFQDSFNKSNMFGVNFEINYDINSNFSIFTRFNYEKFSETKGDMNINAYSGGEVDPDTNETVVPAGISYLPDGSSGGEMYTTSYLLGLKLRL